MSGLTDALSASRADDRRKAARALLKRPLLHAGDDAFVQVRRHAPELREWFERNTGWRLHVDSEAARLVKIAAATSDHTHPARDVRSKQPFGRRRYVLTCLALATLERADAQITLGRLAEQVVLEAGDPALAEAGITFTLDGREQRSDLVAVVRLLLDLRVLGRVAGDEEAFIRDTSDVLYDVNRRVLAGLLATTRGPSTVDESTLDERTAALVAEMPPTTEELRNRRLRHRLTRRLLEEPALYYDELDDPERAYLTRQRSAITARIGELTGLVAEVRAEGIAMVDPFEDLTDVHMPETGTDGHVTLLLAEYLANRSDPVPVAELAREVRRLAPEHKSYWRRSAQEAGAENALVTVALDKLEALRLVVRTGDTVTARPAIARHALATPRVADPSADLLEAGS